MKARHLIFAVVTAVSSSALVLGALELCVRAVFAGEKEYTLEMWRYARQLKRVSNNPRIGHEHVPGRSAHLMGTDVSINSQGLRDREIPYQKQPGVLRVMMLGDSLTFGWGADQEQTTPKQLEHLLMEGTGNRYEVINAGVGNYNTDMEVEWMLTEGIKYQPDVIVLDWSINDGEPTPRYQGNWLKENLQSYVYLSGRVDTLLRMVQGREDWQTYYGHLYQDDAPGWLTAQAAVERLGKHCKERGIPCVFANQPELHSLRQYPFRWLNRKLEQLAKHSGMEYVDMLPAVASEPEESLWVTVPDPHPNNRACGLFARHLYRYLLGRQQELHAGG